jgi:hypothetical protein
MSLRRQHDPLANRPGRRPVPHRHTIERQHPRARPQLAGHHAHERRLSGAVRAEDTDRLAVPHSQRDAVQDVDPAVPGPHRFD